ncbi:hypothetical protein ES707_19017 [subsurface metagenome]
MFDVFIRGNLRVNSVLDSVVFRGQSKAVEAHRVKDMVAVHPQEPAVDIGGGVAFGMTYVQTRRGGIGKHIEDIDSLFGRNVRIFLDPEGFVLLPVSLPLLIDPGKG